MSKTTSAPKEDALQTVSRLLDVGKLDTLYRDLYLQRAYELMEPSLSYAHYTQIKESVASLGWVERQLKAAVERGDWAKTRELTERVRTLKGTAAAGGDRMRIAAALYEEAADIPIDPFSPGLHAFVGGTTQRLQQMQDQAIEQLATLARLDPARKDFYKRRGSAFQTLSVKAPAADQPQEKKPTVTAAQLQQQALEALESGNLSQLDQVARQLLEKPAAEEAKQEPAEIKLAEAAELGDDLLYEFSLATLAAASRFGLAPARTASRRQLAYLIPHGWQPQFLKEEIKRRSKDQIERLSYPAGTADPQKEAIEFFLLNPFITSGGTRYQVCLVVEDLLLEDFAEPEPKTKLPRTDLLAALGLESRWGLSRIDIENALLQHGPRLLEDELALDPEAFRLVAIPADIYTHLAAGHGWGQKEMWTHFDGYRVREDGKLHALAGGDQRFGGTHDVVSFNPAYTQEKVLARFAVVQRRRMMTWHRN